MALDMNLEMTRWLMEEGHVELCKSHLQHVLDRYLKGRWSGRSVKATPHSIAVIHNLLPHLLQRGIIQPLTDHEILRDAIQTQQLAFVQALLDAGFVLTDNSLFSPLTCAISTHFPSAILDYVDFKVSKDLIPSPTSLIWQLLTEYAPNSKLYDRLILLGADVFTPRKDQFGRIRTILQHLVFVREFHCERALELLQSTMRQCQLSQDQLHDWITARNVKGRTILHQACYYGLESMVRFVLSISNLDLLSLTDQDGRIALHHVVIGKGNRDDRKRCGKLLFQHAQSVYLTRSVMITYLDNYGKSSLDYARESNQELLIAFLSRELLIMA
jgi:hypothetical protein